MNQPSVEALLAELPPDVAADRHVMKPGMSYQVASDETPHRSRSPDGATLFIVD